MPNEVRKRTTDFEWFRDSFKKAYNYVPDSLSNFAKASVGDLLWCRDLSGRYILAELTGRWEYSYEDSKAIDCDIVNFRQARLVEVGLADAVPGKIVACFRPALTFQPIKSPGMLAFSEKIAGLPISGETPADLYEYLSD